MSKKKQAQAPFAPSWWLGLDRQALEEAARTRLFTEGKRMPMGPPENWAAWTGDPKAKKT